MEASLRAKIARLPAAPGVYMMRGHGGRVIYVGKAVNLRERVRSYLVRSDPRAFVPFLDEVLGDIEVVLVRNEKEALLLENELVRGHKPRFNIKLQDGKNFVYLRLDPRETYPRLEVTREVKNDGARYFGPYPLARALRETLRVVNRYFKLRTCSDHDPATHKRRPCLLCQIARFPAPSVYDVSPQEYARHVQDAILFLTGKGNELIEALQTRSAGGGGLALRGSRHAARSTRGHRANPGAAKDRVHRAAGQGCTRSGAHRRPPGGLSAARASGPGHGRTGLQLPPPSLERLSSATRWGSGIARTRAVSCTSRTGWATRT
jgi:hypothetical protein